MHRVDMLLAAATLAFAASNAGAATLRVCADPNNLPYSNRAGEGFENKIAERVAYDLGDKLSYSYALQNDKFIKHTLDANACDAIMGISSGMDGVLTTRPYYASTYVFVSRRADRLRLASLSDARLRRLRIGVHLIGDDSTPPALALGEEGIVDNVRGYMIYGDVSRPNPPARLIEAVEQNAVDVALVWGPLAGYYADHSPVPLAVAPVAGTARFAPLKFRFAISMGVRKNDPALRNRLDALIAHDGAALRKILVAYGVPLVPIHGGSNG